MERSFKITAQEARAMYGVGENPQLNEIYDFIKSNAKEITEFRFVGVMNKEAKAELIANGYTVEQFLVGQKLTIITKISW